jgi:hypothetical protein
MTTYEHIFLGHDNVIDLLLTADGDIVDISNTTRATALFDSTLIDSDTSMSVFDWSEGEDGILHLTFGEESIPTGSYKVVITLYDAVHTDGIVWDDFRCRVIGEELSPVPPTAPPILISQGGTGQSTAHSAFNALKQIATETYTGVTELATSAECVTGSDTGRTVTPYGMTQRFRSPPVMGDVTPAVGNFTELDVSNTPITNSYWRSVHPFLDENYSNVKGLPAQVARGLFRGYTFKIWSTPANQFEELLFKMRVPFRWDGVTNPWFVAITAPSGSEIANNRYQFQFEWESADIGEVLPDTICETLTSEVVLVSGGNAAWYAHIIAFEVNCPTMVSGQNVQARLRRIAATVDEVAAEPVVFHWDTRWKMSNIGSAVDMGYP